MSEATLQVPAGLRARAPEGGTVPVPLEGVKVQATIRDCAVRVVLEQRYRNHESQPIEAVYVFPLDEAAAVCGFEASIGGTRVRAEALEREQAFERYDDALASGLGAYLLDQERPDVFSASIGNLPPGGEVVVTITTVAELQLEGDSVRFVLPTTVSPRYAPAEDQVGVGRSVEDLLNPPVAAAVPYGLELRVDVEMGAPLLAVESPSHAIRVELDGARAQVSLGERLATLDRDFVLLLQAPALGEPRAWLERDEHGLAALVAFRPRFEAGPSPSELVFVVDRSGSMEGTSIEEARNALQLCLRSLTSDQRFNVVGFGSTHELLFPDSRPYDEQSFEQAQRHAARLQADLGGTELLPALEAVFSRPALTGLPRQVFVLTDGEVTNTEAVIALARQHSESTRVFTFGLGAGASQHLVKGLARAGCGAAEFIAPGERLEGKVLRQLQRALQPALTEVALDWGGRVLAQAPFHVPPVFDGGRLLAYGRVRGEGPFEVVLRARAASGPREWRVALDPQAATPGSLISTLCARAEIRDLEEGMSALHDRRGSLQDRGQGGGRVKREIVRLGVTYGLASRHTSFVAVEQRETPVSGQAELRRVPIALTRGWGGEDQAPKQKTGAFRSFAPAPSRPAPAPAAMMDFSMEEASFDLGADESFDLQEEESFGQDLAMEAEAPEPVAGSLRPLDRLVALQRFDGSWELTGELAGLVGVGLERLEAALGARQAEQAARRALATALALRWLELHAAEARDEWALLAKKAQAFLARQAGDWTAQAERLLG